MDANTEKQLIEQARKDPEKFGVLFDEYYSPIFNYTLKRVVDVQLAQDITANVFYKAYQKLWQFRWRGLPFVAWLYRIAGNEIKSHYRKNRKVQVSLDELKELSGFEPEDLQNVEEEMVETENEIARHKQFLKIQGLIGKLDDKYREVLYLRFFEDKKIREIGDILGKREGTVKSLISRALSRLRLLLAKSASEGEVDEHRVADNVLNYQYKYVNKE